MPLSTDVKGDESHRYPGSPYDSMDGMRIMMSTHYFKVVVSSSVAGSNCFELSNIKDAANALGSAWMAGMYNVFTCACVSFFLHSFMLCLQIGKTRYTHTISCGQVSYIVPKPSLGWQDVLSRNLIRAAVIRAGYWLQGTPTISSFTFQIQNYSDSAPVVIITIVPGAMTETVRSHATYDLVAEGSK